MHSIHVGFENAHLRAPDFPAGFRVRPFVRPSVRPTGRSVEFWVESLAKGRNRDVKKICRGDF